MPAGKDGWAEKVASALTAWGIDGAPVPLPGREPFRLRSARELADDHRVLARRLGLAMAIDRLIETQARWNAGTGFLSGCGGFAFLPLQLPAAVTATWVIQTRLVATIADLHGFDLEHEAVRTEILLTLMGEEAGEVLRQFGIKAGQQFAQAQLRQLPQLGLDAINRAVGFRLVSRFGSRGVLRLQRVIPLLGGVMGGGIDYLMTRRLGEFARHALARRVPDGVDEEGVIDVEVIR
jgi:uncharacterized protein (DUF697 family)